MHTAPANPDFLEGTVTNINLRYITIASSDGEVLIPSSTVLTDPVVVLNEAEKTNASSDIRPTRN